MTCITQNHILPLFLYPGEVNVSLTLSDPVELPTLVMANVSWGDLLPPDVINLTQATQPGSKVNHTQILGHTYEESGEFLATLVLYNGVSSVDLSFTVSGGHKGVNP